MTTTAPAPDLARDAARASRLLVLGLALKVWRLGQALSVEQVAARLDLSHMTVRRVEEGLEVRSRSLHAVDRAFGYALGTIAQALHSDRAMLDVAVHAGVIHAPGPDEDPADVLEGVVAGALGAHAVPRRPQGPGDLTALELANRLLERVALDGPPTPALGALMRAAQDAMPDLIDRHAGTAGAWSASGPG